MFPIITHIVQIPKRIAFTKQCIYLRIDRFPGIQFVNIKRIIRLNFYLSDLKCI